MSTPGVEGGCLCGAVRYRASGRGSQATWCHCRTCRKAAGAPAVAWVTFPAKNFTFVRGRPVQYRSSKKVIRTFCGECGTPLTYVHQDAADGIDVTTCSLDVPEKFPPSDHTWVSQRLDWVEIGDHLPQHRKARPR